MKSENPLVEAAMEWMQDDRFRIGFMQAVRECTQNKRQNRFDGTSAPTQQIQHNTQYGIYPTLLSNGQQTFGTNTGLPIHYDEEGNVVMPQGTKGTMTTPEVVVTYSATTPGFENLKRNEDYVQPNISSIDEVHSTDFSLDPRTWTSRVNPVKAVRNAIDNYFYEGQHHLDQPSGFAELMRHGKYGLPIAAGTAGFVGSLIDAPVVTVADLAGGWAAEDITNEVSERLTGKGIGEHVADAAGFRNPVVSEIANPFSYLSPWQSKRAAKYLIDHIVDGQPSTLTNSKARWAKKKLLEAAHDIVSPSAPTYQIPSFGILDFLDNFKFGRPFRRFGNTVKRNLDGAPEKYGREFMQNASQSAVDSDEE